VDQKRQQNIKKNKVSLRKFYKPFIATYIFFSVAISFYPSFDFYSFKGQLLILSVSIFNGVMGFYVKKL
tara:strand:+ start:605 stop:811 length:207 start_codon:yes stop_codon:yes gene_type:complete